LQADARISLELDSNGRIIRMNVDADLDLTINSVVILTYNSSGDLNKAEEDFNNDGSIDYSFDYVYDSNGRLIEIHEYAGS